MERESKLKPKMFLETVMFKELNNGEMSLNDHCISIKQEHGITIQKQSLDERFNPEAVSFVKELLKEQLSNQIHGVLKKEKLTDLLKHFSSVDIKDSTRYQVTSNLREHYPGPGGDASGAGLHIQFEFDLKTGQVKDLHVTDALKQDATDAIKTVGEIKKNSLILRDLGYFSTDVLAEISAKEAYYITRPSFTLFMYKLKDEEKIDFADLHKMMKRKKLPWIELDVLLGSSRLPARLVVEMIPASFCKGRLTRMKDSSRRRGVRYTKEYRVQQQLNIFITNVPSELIPAKELRKIYQLRWQIELRFKAWKSFYHLEAIKKMKIYRFECYLFSTLLLLMINWEIAINFFSILWNHAGKTLSILKFHKATSAHLNQLRIAILKGKGKLREFLSLFYEISFERLLTEKKKEHRGLQEILQVQ